MINTFFSPTAPLFSSAQIVFQLAPSLLRLLRRYLSESTSSHFRFAVTRAASTVIAFSARFGAKGPRRSARFISSERLCLPSAIISVSRARNVAKGRPALATAHRSIRHRQGAARLAEARENKPPSAASTRDRRHRRYLAAKRLLWSTQCCEPCRNQCAPPRVHQRSRQRTPTRPRRHQIDIVCRFESKQAFD